MHNVFDLAKETTPADTYDALASIVGKQSQKVINGLHYIGDGQFFGRAVTLRSLPARTDHIKEVNEHSQKDGKVDGPLGHAISLCGKESVLVVDASGYNHSAIGGGTRMSELAARNAVGLVTDGALRDKGEFERYAETYDMKTACADWTVQSGTYSALYPSDVNVPISVHGVLVRPGDYIFGDKNAILVIPEDHIKVSLEVGIVYTTLNNFITRKREEAKADKKLRVNASDPAVRKEFLSTSNLTERQIELYKKHDVGVA